jgi:hypothetical protein
MTAQFTSQGEHASLQPGVDRYTTLFIIPSPG